MDPLGVKVSRSCPDAPDAPEVNPAFSAPPPPAPPAICGDVAGTPVPVTGAVPAGRPPVTPVAPWSPLAAFPPEAVPPEPPPPPP